MSLHDDDPTSKPQKHPGTHRAPAGTASPDPGTHPVLIRYPSRPMPVPRPRVRYPPLARAAPRVAMTGRRSTFPSVRSWTAWRSPRAPTARNAPTIAQLQAEIARLEATLQALQAGPAPGPDPLAAAVWLDPDVRCPRCGDGLQLVHVPADLSRPSTDWPRTPNDWRPTHVLGCRSYPQCTYTEPYDAPLHAFLTDMQGQILWLTAQVAWLRARQEVTP